MNAIRIIVKNKTFLIYKFKKLYFNYYRLFNSKYNTYIKFVIKELNKVTVNNISSSKLKDLMDIINHFANKRMSEIAKKHSINNKEYISIKRINNCIINDLSKIVQQQSQFARVYIDFGYYMQYYVHDGYSIDEILFGADEYDYWTNIQSFEEYFDFDTMFEEIDEEETKIMRKEYAIREWYAWEPYNEQYDNDLI